MEVSLREVPSCFARSGRVLVSAVQLAAHSRQRPGQGDLINHLSGTKAVQGFLLRTVHFTIYHERTAVPRSAQLP